MTLPSILYAIENSKGRYWSYVLSPDPSSALAAPPFFGL